MDGKDIERISEMVIRRVFSHFMDEVLPEVLDRVVGAHNSNEGAHSRQISRAIAAETARVKLWMMSLVFVGGLGGGAGLLKFLM